MGPFEEHLHEAIEINKKRSHLYAQLSGGRSVPISRALVLSERLSLPFARIPDLWSTYFRKRGIPIVELEFISMDQIPEFSERLPFPPHPLHSFQPGRGWRLAISLLFVFIKSGWQGTRQHLRAELKSLEQQPGFHVMLRHVLESMLRISSLAPIHVRRCREKRLLFTTQTLSAHLYLSHLSALPFATWIDGGSAPLLAEGIPILFQDVPPIPETAPGYE
jgi:hypothetical protein